MGQRLIAAFAATSLFATPVAAQQSIHGTYVDSGGYTEITVGYCGNRRCGDITRIIRSKPGEPNRDVHNDNPALRDRPILGLRVLHDLRWDDGAWRGEVYNPEDGNTYRAEVRPGANGALEVQGCVAFFCRTRLWPAAD
jgi:uncharacterized protein (DUF2147 family)